MHRTARPLLGIAATLASATLLLTACSSGGSDSTSTDPANDETVAFVSTQAAGDDSGVDDLINGLDKIKTNDGVQTKYVEATDPSTFETSVRNVAQGGANIVAGAFPDITNALNTVAPDFPDTQFVHIFADAPETPIDNLTTVSFDVYKALYIAGHAAASLSDSGTIGWIGGAGSPLLNANFHAYKAGAEAADPNVKVLSGIVGSFSDPAKGRDIALGMISQGADVLQTDAGGSSVGIIEAASTSGVLVFTDASSDVAEANPTTVVGLTYLRFGDALADAVSEILDSGKSLGTYSAGLDKDLVGVSVADSFLNGGSPKAATVKDLQPKLDDLKQQIVDGKVEVPYNTDGI